MRDDDDYPDSRRGAEMAADRIGELEADVERLTGDREELVVRLRSIDAKLVKAEAEVARLTARLATCEKTAREWQEAAYRLVLPEERHGLDIGSPDRVRGFAGCRSPDHGGRVSMGEQEKGARERIEDMLLARSAKAIGAAAEQAHAFAQALACFDNLPLPVEDRIHVINSRRESEANNPDDVPQGLTCPDCGARQKRINAHMWDGALLARISMRIDSQKSLRGLWSVLRMFIEQLPKEGPKVQGKAEIRVRVPK